MFFAFEAKNQKGGISKGRVEAANKQAALATLRETGLFVMDIKESYEMGFLDKIFSNRIPLKDKIVFVKQLSIMIRSGLSLLDALKSLSGESINKALARTIDSLIADVEGGSSLSSALNKHPEIFGETFVNMVRSGEESGKLDMVLERLALHLEKEYELIRKVKGALAYPAFVVVVMVLVIALVIVMVIPQLKVIFDEAGVKLPLTTRMLIATSMFLKNFGLYLLIAIAAAVAFLGRWQRKTKKGKEFFDRLVLRIPVISTLLKKSYLARFTRTFSALLASGLPLLEVMKSSSKVVGNSVYEQELELLAKKVETGSSLASVFKSSEIFPGIVGQLAAVGEKSGNVDEVFDSLAGFFDREVDSITSNLSALLEPILMVIIGFCIGVVIMSVLQPIYGLVNAM